MTLIKSKAYSILLATAVEKNTKIRNSLYASKIQPRTVFKNYSTVQPFFIKTFKNSTGWQKFTIYLRIQFIPHELLHSC